MKLDSNRAWKEASRSISRNREALLAVAGVFFLLPQLALALFYPQPEPAVGMSEQQIVALTQKYYLSALPALIPLVVCQAVGTLSLLGLLSHATRPTVGEALRIGLAGLLTYLGAQILVGVGIGAVGGILLGALGVAGGVAVATVGLVALLAVAVAIALRVSLCAPVVAVEGERSPIRALARSWRLTRGNAWRLLGFYALFLVASSVILVIIGLIVGIPLQMLAPGFVAAPVSAVVSSAANALMALYLVAIIGAVHDQLTGPTPEQERRPFV